MSWKSIAVILACLALLLGTNARVQYTVTNAFNDSPAK